MYMCISHIRFGVVKYISDLSAPGIIFWLIESEMFQNLF